MSKHNSINKTLKSEELERYSRHILLPEVGLEGQKRIKQSNVLVIGAGGLGAPTLLYLAAAGVGKLGIVDFDKVETSNLQRQVIHNVSTVGHRKVESAKKAIEQLNPLIDVELYEIAIDATNALVLIEQYDMVLDCTDNFGTRFLVNDACALLNKPYIWGSVYRFEGQVSVFWEQPPNREGRNYRDLYAEPPPAEFAPSCAEGGVMGCTCGVVGSIMATETIKLITGIGETLLGKLLRYDALNMRFDTFKIAKDDNRVKIDKLIDNLYSCSLDIELDEVQRISVKALNEAIQANKSCKIIDIRETLETSICKLDQGESLIPKNDFLSRIRAGEEEKEAVFYVFCKHGKRSDEVVRVMNEHGYEHCFSVEGGLMEWSQKIDASVARY